MYTEFRIECKIKADARPSFKTALRVTDEQICAIGALTSLGEAMGHEVITAHAREFLEEVSHSTQDATSLREAIGLLRRVRLVHTGESRNPDMVTQAVKDFLALYKE
jgi:hypothetical protein